MLSATGYRRQASPQIAIVIAAAMAIAGCGKKGPPLAPIIHVPAAVEKIEARRLGNEAYITLTVPSANIDATTPADLDRIDVYGFTGRQAPGSRLLAAADLVASIPVEPVPRDESGRPVPRPAGEQIEGALQGESITVRETLTPEKRQPRELPPPPQRRGAPPPPPPLDAPAAPPPIQRYYTAVAVSDRNRTSPGGTIADLPLGPLPDPPTGVTAEYTADVVRLRWEPSGGLLGFLLDRELPKDASPVDEPIDFPALAPSADTRPAAAATAKPGAGPQGAGRPSADLAAGPTRYTVYRELAPDPLVLPTGSQREWLAPLPVAAGAPSAELAFEDPLVIDGRERCYQVRAVRGDGDGRAESDPSPRICFTPVDTVAPAVPTGLTADAEPGAITLTWDPNIEEDLAGYVILRGGPGDATLTPLTASPWPTARYVDRTVAAGTRYVYAVRAVDERVPVGNISDESARVDVAAP